MEQVSKKSAAPRGWRSALAVGLAIGVAVPVARAVGANLEPSLGSWVTFGLNVVVAGAVGGVVAAGVGWLLKPSASRGPDRESRDVPPRSS